MPKSEEYAETYWFPTPQKPGDETQHTPLQKRKLQELKVSQKLKELNRQDTQESLDQFSSNINYSLSTMDKQEFQAVEEIVGEFQVIIARHRFDISINTDFKVKLTPIDEIRAYSQSPPKSISTKENITVGLA